MNLEKMNAAQLRNLRQEIDNAIATKRKEELAALRMEVEKMVAERGFSMSELMSFKNSKAPAIVTYTHPDEPNLKWGGKGVKPKWLKAFLDNGGTLEQCVRSYAQ